MNTLPCDVLGKIFTYLPLKEVVPFELLNRQCGRAIKMNGRYFKKPFILLDINAYDGDQLTWEINVNRQVLMYHYLNEVTSNRQVAKFFLHSNGRIEDQLKNSKTLLPESGGDQFSSLQSIVEWIKWNSTVLHDKWGKRAETPSIQLMSFTGLHFLSLKTQQRIVDVLSCEQCFVQKLNVHVLGRTTTTEIAFQFPLLMYRKNVVEKLLITSRDVWPERVFPLVKEWTKGVVINFGNQYPEDLLNFINKLKRMWNSGRIGQDPWTLGIQFGAYSEPWYQGTRIEDTFIPCVDSNFSVIVKRDEKDPYYEIYRAVINAR